MSRQSKLVELRRKTDRDLLILIQRELDRGLTLADVASTRHSPLFARAERAYQTVKTWLPLVPGLHRAERRELELGLQELRSALERMTSEAPERHFAGASAD